MQYLTFDEYKELGGTLEETAFKRNIDRVNSIIDNATQCRIEKMQSVPDMAKALCRDLIEYLASNSATDRAITGKSQSAGNVSESESYAVKDTSQQTEDMDNMICDYLISVKDDNGTPLLYRGCSV